MIDILYTAYKKEMIVVRNIIISAIKFYRKFISPIKKPCCRFMPTCSEYAIEALSRYGVVKGLYLSVKRILRCSPLSKGGYDPVP